MNLLVKLTLIITLIQTSIFSQHQNLSISNIPFELKKRCNAVIRFDKKEITIKNENNMIVNFSRTITVFNEDGNKLVNTNKYYDNDSKILKISATIYNKQGIEVRKYKKKDFEDQSAISGFYSDNRVKFIDYTPRSYPYTINFSYEFKTHTTAFIPGWYPSFNYKVGVESSEYVLNNTKQIPFKLKEYQFKNHPIKNLSTQNKIHYSVKNIKPINREGNGLMFSAITPHVKVCLENFTLKGHTAYGIKTWKEFGKWLRNNLYNSQLKLSEETKQEVLNLVKNEKDPYKKAKRIYEYMQQKTRYVYVGIGIGGWQPNEANEVDKLSYGDCKGLSNYTKALLDVVGIESDWVIVYAKRKRNFEKEYIGLQGNHMILNLPKLNNGKDVWLECTSQTMPFNFLGNFTDDRDVLVLKKDGGIIKHTPKYIDKNNIKNTTGFVNIDNSGNLNAKIHITSKSLEYNENVRLEYYDDTNVKKYYKSKRWWYNNNLNIEKYSFKNDKNKITFTENLQIKIDDYANILGNEMIIRLNAFDMYTKSINKSKNRKQPLHVTRGKIQNDTINIKIPNGYTITRLPKKKITENQFGTYKVEVFKLDKNQIKYTRNLYFKEDTYNATDYSDYQDFIGLIKAYDNLKIALKKKQQ